MGSTRKLQGEIDRVLKKVQEGVDVFDSIWNKVYDTENANQKEKFEADLKKEIKKLQRYRDQIKTWIQSSEIKEKKALLDARKLIEREMERFKVCEKETKTKAFSKEGLGQQPKTDPREKAKGESRDWLNNMVSDLESQVDSFEAEMEGLTVKKGKTRPPRLTHLEDSISRHKQHINKLELILRLLENDGLSPEEVNDVKDFVEDYVERNQDDFEEFMEVEDLYQSLPLEKLEALEALEAIPVVAPAIIVKEKVAVAAASGVPALNGTNAKSPITTPGAPQAVATAAVVAAVAVVQQASSSSLVLEEVPTQEASGKSGIRIPYLQTGSVSHLTSAVVSNASIAGTMIVPEAANSLLTREMDTGATSVTVPSDTGSGRALGKHLGTPEESSLVHLGVLSKEAEPGDLGRRVISSIAEGVLARASLGRGISATQSAAHTGGFPSTTGIVGGDETGTSSPELRKTGLVGDERLDSGGLAQQLATSLVVPERSFGQPLGLVDPGGAIDSVPTPEGGIIGSRVFSQSVGGQWRLPSASTFQNQSEVGQYHGRTEIAPDQKQKYLQRLQEHQQGQSATLLSAAAAQLSHLSSSNQKSQGLGSAQQLQLQNFPHHEQQQALLSEPSRSSLLQQQQTSLAMGLQQQHSSLPSMQVQQHLVQQFSRPQSSHHLRHGPPLESGSAKDFSDTATGRSGEQQQLQPTQLRLVGENNTNISSLMSSFRRHTPLSEDDSKNADTFDVEVGDPGTLAELSQLSREIDYPPGQAIQAEQCLRGPGIIGKQSLTDVGTNIDLLGATHDQVYNRQALDAAYCDIPLSRDSERPKGYIPRYPAATPASYPQVPAAIMDNPALWERLETDVLFLAFYYQQGTFQQYLAARELKKQSWRYHKKYNTWFQRHEQPKVATDEYEQGTYVYFDFHIAPDDFQQGWCQRIKSEFTFEYSYLEDELVL